MSDSGFPPHLRPSSIRRRLLKWFAANRRDLPWRSEPRDPYHVWLSEVMLQQTRVATVIPYYTRWLLRFPTLESVAHAPQDEVLKMWEGIGYYSRVRNFHRAAQIVVQEHNGVVPSSVDILLRLPGIGRYTAGAIASLAYNEIAPTLDGNVRRVLSRLFALQDKAKPSDFSQRLWHIAAVLVADGQAGKVNEALMELGALVCVPSRPDCIHCPLQEICIAYAKGKPEAFPGRKTYPTPPHKLIATAILEDRFQRLLMARRPDQGLLGGLWEFPGTDIPTNQTGGLDIESLENASNALSIAIYNSFGLHINVRPKHFIANVKHAFTHFTITRYIALISVNASVVLHLRTQKYTDVRWVFTRQIQTLPLTRSDQKILQIYQAKNDTYKIPETAA